MQQRGLFTTVYSLVVGLTTASADDGHLDIQLITDGSGMIKSGLIDVEGGGSSDPCPIIDDDYRVFTAHLDEGPVPHFADAPGFNACDGTFEPGSFVGFNIIDALRRWDGEDFDEIPQVETMFVSSGGGNPVFVQTPPEPGGFVEGFDLALTPDDGSMHTHVQYVLDAGGNEPAPGVYLLTIEATSTMAGMGPTPPLYIVFADGAPDAELDAAARYVQGTIVEPQCPGDMDGDGAIDSTDLNLVLGAFGCTGGGCDGDASGDGDTDSEDLNIILGVFGEPCPTG